MSNNTYKCMKYATLFLLLVVLLHSFQTYYKSSYTPTVSQISNTTPISCVSCPNRTLALTFDCAWNDSDINDILRVLNKHHARATFFVTGEWAQKYPDTIKKINENNFELGNCGMNYVHMPTQKNSEIQVAIKQCEDIIYQLTNKHTYIFRAPYCDYTPEVVRTVHMLNYLPISYSIDSLDWKDYGIDSIIYTVCDNKNLNNGAIILFRSGACYTKDALDVMLTKLEIADYSFSTISELIYQDNYIVDCNGKQIAKDE